ncbi:CHAD domain-containing protein [Methylomonas sp. YC3]
MKNTGGKPLLDALERHWRQYRKHLKACRQTASEDNVHELRISTRRLLALIELLHALEPQPTLLSIRKVLKKQLDGFDELRDTQVMLFEAAGSMAILPGLEPFLAFIHQREQHLLINSRAHIVAIYRTKTRRKIQKAAKRFKTEIAGTDLRVAIQSVVDAMYAEVVGRYQALNPADLASFHHLRIAAKKFRYTLLAVPAKFLDLPIDYLKKLQNSCTDMGDIQNSLVLLDALDTFFQHKIPEEIKQHYQCKQQALIEAYTAHLADILDFQRRYAV